MSEGRLGVIECVWWCLLVSVVSGVVFGYLERCLIVYLSNIQVCLGAFVMFWGVSKGSAHVESSQARDNQPFLLNPERQDIFTQHL